MKFIEKISNRYNIVMVFIVVSLCILTFGLAKLTITEGEKYRLESDRIRLKTVPVESARGEIRDRYGRLMAGNETSFTIQIAKDELLKKDRNSILLKLYSILENEGENYIDEFPIVLNYIDFINRKEYFEKKYSILNDEKIINSNSMDVYSELSELVINNGLTTQLMGNYYTHNFEDIKYSFLAGKELLIAVENETQETGINIKFNEFEIVYEIENIDVYNKWIVENKIQNKEPKYAIVEYIEKHKEILSGSLERPVMRQFVYEMLKRKNLAAGFKMEKYAYKYDEKYRSIKRTLIEKYSTITMETSAKDDFYNIVMADCIYQLVYKPIKTGELIGEKLLNELKENQEIPIELGKDINNSPIFKYKLNQKKNFLIKNGLNVDVSPIDAILLLSSEKNILKAMVVDDEVKYIAQKVMLDKGINPKISISKWNYTAILEKNNWMGMYKKIEENFSAEKAFEILCSENYYKIDKSLSHYEARLILTGIDQLQKTGYLAYQPINIAYDVNNITVAKIMENERDLTAVKVNVEPIRSYPMSKTASHILGYLGKISQRSEIDKYIKNGDGRYTPNDIIGKTGIEESYESFLKGIDGSKKVEVDISGNITSVKSEEKAIPGNNVYLSIDSELQKTAEKALEDTILALQRKGVYKSKWGDYTFKNDKEHFKNATSGATVAIDVKTGKVLALVSYPSYDPNLFSTGITMKNWKKLLPENEKDVMAPRPLYNIALQTAIQPGSIFKMITAVAGLENGMDPYRKINSLGYIEYGNTRFGCWYWNGYRRMHGPTNMIDAIRDSCNYYFYTLVLGENLRTSKKLGLNVDIYDIIRVANEFGLNDKTGIEINIPNEKYGGVPNPTTKALYSKRKIRNFLNRNLGFYLEEDVEISDKHKKEIIDEISGWAELEKTPTYNKVYRDLKELGLNPDKSNGNERSLADTIRYRYLYDAGWKTANTLNVSIGQGENQYTPIQMANYISTLVNGGLRHEVSVIENVRNYTNKDIISKPIDEYHEIELSNNVNLDIIKNAMGKVASDGTARRIFRDFPIKVGAKTGTAEKDGINPITKSGYDSYGWFVTFAPYDDPQIAVATVIFQAGHGGSAGPLSRDIMAQYLGLNYDEDKVEFKSTLLQQ